MDSCWWVSSCADYFAELDLLIGVLDESVPADQLTADQYVIGIEQGVVSDKKGKRIVGVSLPFIPTCLSK